MEVFMDVMGIAAEFVQTGMDKSGIQLTHNLEAYLAITFARYITREIDVDRLTVRAVSAMDANAPSDILRDLADQTLIACSFFEERLRRSGVVRHYIGVGQVTYDAAGLVEQAYGFVHMRDVVSYSAKTESARHLLDLARGGSTVARKELGNVVVGPWGKGTFLK